MASTRQIERAAPARRRAVSAMVGFGLLALAAWLVLAWVDKAAGYDATCENAVRFWTSAPRRASCQAEMGFRVIAAAAFASLGGCYLVHATFPEGAKRLRPLASRLVVAGLLVAITAALIWNEFTRSGGLWEHG